MYYLINLLEITEVESDDLLLLRDTESSIQASSSNWFDSSILVIQLISHVCPYRLLHVVNQLIDLNNLIIHKFKCYHSAKHYRL
jgi:hypothetical protein